MSDGQPVFRDGQLIAKTHRVGDLLVVSKPGPLKDNQVMDITGAPGWDKELIDSLDGNVELTFERRAIVYKTSLSTFRQHSFTKTVASYGTQYHCHLRYYQAGNPTPPSKEKFIGRLTFGFDRVCPSCHGRSDTCGACGGTGVVRST